MDTRHKRPCQRDYLLALLKRHAPDWVSLAQILAIAGAQYGARIYELRRLGHRIESKSGGGWFRLVIRPTAADLSPALPPTPSSASDADRLFPDDAPLPHLDLG
jgi:hypothetical protein